MYPTAHNNQELELLNISLQLGFTGPLEIRSARDKMFLDEAYQLSGPKSRGDMLETISEFPKEVLKEGLLYDQQCSITRTEAVRTAIIIKHGINSDRVFRRIIGADMAFQDHGKSMQDETMRMDVMWERRG
ncbi:uncharacterized protein LOC134264630 [Saccostrea cucullata]|uniref:uncharacterized protein LOC134264630 n=1 Tax=Saccostrea cuccullata TaxID=36930 RepID=UPI002ED51B21